MKNPLALLPLLFWLWLGAFACQAEANRPLTPPPTVPAAFDALGLHLTLDADAQRLTQAKVNSLCRHSSAFQARVALAAQAFPLLDRVLLAEGVPADFRYLAVQESALRGDAASPHGAVGYWQLKRETARSLGLTVDERIDERQHAAASTRAAARYLARNQAELRNWLNTLLSYYLGPSGVRAAVRATDPDATEMALTGQSNSYLFDFLAHKIAFEPALAAAAPATNIWREVPAAAGQTLDQQATDLGLDPNALAALNPWLLASAVPADGRAHTWVIAAPAPVATPIPAPTPTPAPTSSAPAETPAPPVAEQPAPSTAPSAPTAGPVSAAPANPLPAPASPVPAPVSSAAPATPGSPSVTTPHRVVAGETLYSLARQLDVRPADLASLNQLPPNTLLRVGQPLLLPAAGPGAPVASSYVVAKGDTFYSISRRFGCSVGVLQAFNVRPGSALRVGELLRVPAR